MKTFVKSLMFDFWYWIHKTPWDTNQTPPEVIRWLAEHPPGRALDLGCGTGTNVITFRKHGWEAEGVDFSPRAVALARKKAAAAGIEARFTVHDISRLEEWSGPYDLILDIGCLHILEPDARRRAVGHVKRLLAPGGAYLLYAFTVSDPDDRPGLTEPAIEEIGQTLRLFHRENGFGRADRRSAWLWFGN